MGGGTLADAARNAPGARGEGNATRHPRRPRSSHPRLPRGATAGRDRGGVRLGGVARVIDIRREEDVVSGAPGEGTRIPACSRCGGAKVELSEVDRDIKCFRCGGTGDEPRGGDGSGRALPFPGHVSGTPGEG